ncbi:peroxisomal sarcosine oxidase-like [Diadema setosum]|uniref:peroxisomal sarcosine oxidase-like n=1 Tax=Diadema setosum TaxID=31175 RepID=UPI003B3A8B26
MYDVCVVGGGMVGSAAARWLSLKRETKVCLIGPREPTDEQEWNSPDREIFGCHYDEGRITRELDQDPIWALLAKRSIERYRDIERESGLKFYEEVGCLFLVPKGSESNQACRRTADTLGIKNEIMSSRGVHSKFPYLRVEEDTEGIWTPHRAGFISPRTLVSAQQRIALRNECRIINDVVVKVEEESQGDGDRDGREGGRGGGEGGDGCVKVTTKTGTEIRARRVLLCCGASTNFYHLLPPEKKLDYKSLRTLVVLAEMSAADLSRFRGMPSIAHWDCYALPPIKYPDGKYYLKLGLWPNEAEEVTGLSESAAWYRSHGKGWDLAKTMTVFRALLPDLKPVSMVTNCCLTTLTPSGQLYCDMASPRVGVLACMNGYGAKSSDEIGRMGALMISKGSWDHDLPAETFKLRFKPAKSHIVSKY